jgi:superfamily II DNA helicase RecQ
LSNLKREQEIAVKDLLTGKNVLAVLPTGYGKSLIFTLFLLARENITRINTDGRWVFIATPTGLKDYYA